MPLASRFLLLSQVMTSTKPSKKDGKTILQEEHTPEKYNHLQEVNIEHDVHSLYYPNEARIRFHKKKKGCCPAGRLAPTSKATRFNSISGHNLHNKYAKVLEPQLGKSTASREKSPLSNKGSLASKRSHDNEKLNGEQNEGEPSEPLQKVRKTMELAIRAYNESSMEDIVLPLGTPLTEVAGTELSGLNAGAAL